MLGVFTGSSISQLNQVAANDDLYPITDEYNEMVQNIYSTNSSSTVIISGNSGGGGGSSTTQSGSTFGAVLDSYYLPFWGPSGLRFNAKAGTTYFFVADSKPSYLETLVMTNEIIGGVSYTYEYYVLTDIGRGNISLNWAYHPSGVFRFATKVTTIQ